MRSALGTLLVALVLTSSISAYTHRCEDGSATSAVDVRERLTAPPSPWWGELEDREVDELENWLFAHATVERVRREPPAQAFCKACRSASDALNDQLEQLPRQSRGPPRA